MNFYKNMIESTGYNPITTFWEDFTIADAYGRTAIKDTYERAFSEWKTDYKFLTELVLILNWKCWYYYDKNNAELSLLYEDLFYKTSEWAINNLKGEALTYYFRITD